jgi:hypothetical protein
MALLRQAGETWIVLDALDECSALDKNTPDRSSSRKVLLQWIEDLRRSGLNTHILVTSRPEMDIKSAIEGWARNEEIITLQSQLLEDDIKSYIYTKTKQMLRWKDRPDIQTEIESALIKKADGM